MPRNFHALQYIQNVYETSICAMTGNVFPWIGNVMDIVIAMIQKMKNIVKVEDPLIYFHFVYLTIYFVMGIF